MPTLWTGPDEVRVEVRQAELALLQNAAESLRNPGYDLFPFLADRRDRWSTRFFDERTYGGVLGTPAPFDALIVGYNAIHLSDDIKAALNAAPPAANLMLLHQLRTDCLEFLRDELALRPRPLAGGGTTHAFVPLEREPFHEPLLNWPATVGLAAEEGPPAIEGRALRFFSFAPGSAWRVVLEARRGSSRLPVVVRTTDLVPQRIVACTLLLEPRRPEHAALLENMIAYAAGGRPEVAVLELDDAGEAHYEPARITERLRLQGTAAIHARLPSKAVMALGRWPLAGVQRVVVPHEVSYADALIDPDADAWFKAGGTLVRVGREDRLTIHTGTTDLFWVARRWAVWFNGCEPRRWQRSLFASRAVLLMLEALAREDVDRESLGLAIAPAAFRRPVAALLAARIRNGSAEETIGATAAAHDLHRLLGDQGFSPFTAASVARWLEEHATTASLEDRLDIARCLRRADLLAAALDEIERRDVSATLVTRLQDAVWACRPDAGDAPGTPSGPLAKLPDAITAGLADHRVIDELKASPVLAAEFLAGHFACDATDAEHPLSANEQARAAALSSLMALQRLANTEDAEGNGYAITVEALALLSYLRVRPGVAAFNIRPQGRELPVKAVEAVLEETRRARAEEERALADAPRLGLALQLLGTVGIALAATAILALLGWLGVEVSGGTAIVAGSAAVVVFGLVGALRWRLRPEAGVRAAGIELRLAQTLLGVLALLAGIAFIVLATTLVTGLLPVLALVAVGFGITATIVAGLHRSQLNPPWMVGLLGVVGEPRGLLDWARARLKPPA